MAHEGPFREEGLETHVEALRVERDNLARSLAVALAEAKAASRRRWSWRRFVLGFCILPVAAVLIARVMGR
ncbi:MAG TPA: hypothetical protein VGL81_08020 [Polyangiaceae bacterium]|jgi:hypothetical protein